VNQDLVNDPVPVPYVYAARQLSDKAYIGLGFYAPYGSGLAWRNPDEFVGRTQLREISLRTFYFTPTVALELNEMISVAVGVSLVPATLFLEQEIGATDNQQPLFPQGSLLEVSANAFGVGATAGVHVDLIDHLRLGFVFKSAVDLSFDGDANFTVPEDVPLSVRQNFPDQTGSGAITLPHSFGLGVGWEQGPLTLEAGAQLTLWESYDELRLNFDTGRPSPSSATPKDWNSTPLFRVGAEYRLGDLALRLGGGYDISPVPQTTADFSLPDNDRIYYSVGAGYDFGPVRADLAYMGLWITERELDGEVNVNIPTGGTFNGGFAHVMSLSVGFRI
jgi:long-chain fatty acid transport protein